MSNLFFFIDEQLICLWCGLVDFVDEDQFKSKLQCVEKIDMLLMIKIGFDLMLFDLYLGYIVFLCKMCYFQDCGYCVVFFIGDFIVMIGDLMGKKLMCFQFIQDEVVENVKIYKIQVFCIFDEEKIVVEYNSQWFSLFGSEGMI